MFWYRPAAAGVSLQAQDLWLPEKASMGAGPLPLLWASTAWAGASKLADPSVTCS